MLYIRGRSPLMAFSPEDSLSLETSRRPDDGELVALAQGGDQSAFEHLFERYNRQICLYMTRMVGNDSTGCDLTQETFLKAWESLSGLRDVSRFPAWLYRIATNIARDYQRRVRNAYWLPWDMYREQENLDGIRSVGMEHQVEETELLTLALAHVSLTYRACLIFYLIEELPQRQIAERLGIKESSVSKYVSRGLEELRHIYFRLSGETAMQEKRR